MHLEHVEDEEGKEKGKEEEKREEEERTQLLLLLHSQPKLGNLEMEEEEESLEEEGKEEGKEEKGEKLEEPVLRGIRKRSRLQSPPMQENSTSTSLSIPIGTRLYNQVLPSTLILPLPDFLSTELPL